MRDDEAGGKGPDKKEWEEEETAVGNFGLRTCALTSVPRSGDLIGEGRGSKHEKVSTQLFS
jgi:hypothetical protein